MPKIQIVKQLELLYLFFGFRIIECAENMACLRLRMTIADRMLRD
ncbi:MAG: hypothetical protein N2647_04635 [Thermodesulfovibrio sp.]|nr:hypothetical protein [Thermodesulfovibrio sp.]